MQQPDWSSGMTCKTKHMRMTTQYKSKIKHFCHLLDVNFSVLYGELCRGNEFVKPNILR